MQSLCQCMEGVGFRLCSVYISCLSFDRPIIAVVYLQEGRGKEFEETLRSLDLPSRIEVITAENSKKNVYVNHFPINLLRNVGLMSVTTSHVMVIDSDCIPAGRNMNGNNSSLICRQSVG